MPFTRDDHITAFEVHSLTVIEFKPDLTLEDHGIVDRMCSVHRWIFFFEVVGQSRQAAQQRRDANPRLEARQVYADADVRPLSKRQMTARPRTTSTPCPEKPFLASAMRRW